MGKIKSEGWREEKVTVRVMIRQRQGWDVDEVSLAANRHPREPVNISSLSAVEVNHSSHRADAARVKHICHVGHHGYVPL